MRSALALLALAFLAASPSPAPAPPLFTFHCNEWVNLHHFLRAAGRGMPLDLGALTPDERATWDRAVALYGGSYSQRDVLFDDGMVAIKNALRGFAGAATLAPQAALPEDLRTALNAAEPVYRAHWWPAHDAANRAWIAAVEPLVARYGRALAAGVAAAYDETWPDDPIPVDLSVQAGPVGAYTTAAPTATTISATDLGYQGRASLEMVFHEASHRWGRRLYVAVDEAAKARHREVPPQLWHAVLFYNAGELTRRALAGTAPAYVEYAEAQKVYPALCGEGCRARVAAAWDPHLAGTVSWRQAIENLVERWPAPAAPVKPGR